MTTQEPPKIEFPCEDYIVKIMGDASVEFEAGVLEIVERHAPGFNREKTKIRPSSKGRFESLSVWITATGEDQLRALFEDLKKHPAVKMVL